MKNKILELLESKEKGLTKKQLEEALGLSTSSDFALLSRTLDDLEDSYEVARNKKNAYVLGEYVGFYTGKLSISSRGNGYLDLKDGSSIQISENDLLDALDGDEVVVKKESYGNYGSVVAVKERARQYVVGTYLASKRGLQLELDDEKLKKKRIKVVVPKTFTPVDGLKVYLKITRYGNTLELAYDKTIGHKDDPKVDVLAILLDHEINPEFTDDVMAEAESVAQPIQEKDIIGRRDLRDILTITIDGDDSKDFDDAISITPIKDGWNLKVSIADVSHYVREDGWLDREAYKRGTSTYAIDSVVPMLPHLLSNGICSLNPKEDRLTVTCDMNITKNGMVSSYEIYPSIIVSNERMTYSKVNRILGGDTELQKEYEHLGNLLFDMNDCAKAIRKRRESQGAIEFESTESEITVNEMGFPIGVAPRTRGDGECAIEDFMIVANTSVANYLLKNHIPGVYRVHGTPEARKIGEFKKAAKVLGRKLLVKDQIRPLDIQAYLRQCMDDDNYALISGMLLRCMQKACYDAHCIGHFGLAEQEYLHFTSPIRRYPDLVVHRMLHRYVFEKCDDPKQREKDFARMGVVANQSSKRERMSVEAEREADDMKKAEYMTAHLGEEYDGMITSITSRGLYVSLPNTVEGLVSISELDDYFYYDEAHYELIGQRSNVHYRLGQTIRIKVLSANKELRLVRFGIVESHKKSAPKKNYQTRSRSAKKTNDRKGRGNRRGRSKK